MRENGLILGTFPGDWRRPTISPPTDRDTRSIQSEKVPTYRLDIEYDGTDWHGWQIQPGLPTVQSAIQDAISIITRERVAVVGSGRTDAGVHASGQVAHLVLAMEVEPDRLQRSLNGVLDESIVVRSVSRVHDDFHARYDAVRRTYRYQVCCTPVALERSFRWLVLPEPDFHRMNTAACEIVGMHDFSSFCRTGSETKNRVCTVTEATWAEDPRDGDRSFVISADRFLHGMVRAIVGTLIEIGHGKRSPDEMGAVLKAQDRRQAGQAAPAKGLILAQVDYPNHVG